MNFPQAIVSGFSHYFDFRGRASRSEYWYWILFTFLLRFAAGIMDAVLFPTVSPFSFLAILITIVPNLSVAVRRMHDIDRNWWWLLLDFTIIGFFYPILPWLCRRGDEGSNRFGPPGSLPAPAS